MCHTTDVFFGKDCFIILTDAIRQWNGYEGRCFVFHSENCRTIDEISVGVQLSSYKVLHWKALERYSWTGTASLQSLKNCNSFMYIFIYNFMYLFFFNDYYENGIWVICRPIWRLTIFIFEEKSSDFFHSNTGYHILIPFQYSMCMTLGFMYNGCEYILKSINFICYIIPEHRAH